MARWFSGSASSRIGGASGFEALSTAHRAHGDGVRRDWDRLVCAELCDARYGLFGSRDGGNSFEPNQHSGSVAPDHLDHFELLGKVAMDALANGEVVEGVRPFFVANFAKKNCFCT